MSASRTPSGVFVAVVGPSGVGKDTLLNYAKARLADQQQYVFVRRTITRAPFPGEDHAPVTPSMFASACQENSFALYWNANDIWYGVPIDADRHVSAGRTVIANLSRAVLADVRVRYRRRMIVRITAPVDVVRMRLASRAREGQRGIDARLARFDDPVPDADDVIEIENAGDIVAAGDALVAAITQAI